MGSNKKKRNKNKSEQHTEFQQTDDNNEDLNHDNTENNDEKTPTKRKIDDDDSGSEAQVKKPKKMKKKKQESQTESSGKKGKKSIRQMKREKHAQRQADADAAAKDQLKSQCLNYLSQWKHDRQNWKFMKAKQVWLYKNKFSSYLVPNESWPVLLEYFEAAKGNIRNMLLDDAQKIIKQMDDWTESHDKNNEDSAEKGDSDAEIVKPNDSVYTRARNLIQCLQE